MTLDLGLIIPTYNMAEHLPRLFASLVESGLVATLREVVLVDDGSTDSTPELLKNFADAYATTVRIVTLPSNKGRFHARFEGAKASSCDKVLFLDTRLELEAGFLSALCALAPEHRALMGVVNIDTSSSVFSLYWDRTHRVLFRRHFEAAAKGFYLTPENYDQYLKGTGVFMCLRDEFLLACQGFLGTDLLSDDTALMKLIVQKDHIWVDARLAIRWRPRENALDFLARLWERGPSFVEYHIFTRRGGPMFWVVCAGLLGCLAALAGLVVDPQRAALVLFAGVCAMAASVGVFARSSWEFCRLVPLHLAVLLTFGAAILRGLFVNVVRVMRGRFPRIAAASYLGSSNSSSNHTQ
jgi:glycosyltransferase involved in cell wall biosynthesis